MLTQIRIRNLAVVEELDLGIEQGMTVLTGETGAGKSIVVDALGLVLGDRADSDVIRGGADRAEVCAVFDIGDAPPALAELLSEQEIEAPDAELFVRRTLSRDGRSRGFLNGTPVPVQTLRAVGEHLIDIHGQHAHQSLTRREMQRQLLDEFGGLEAEASAVAAACEAWRSATRELAAAGSGGAEREAQLALLRYQMEELDAAAPEDGEIEALDGEHRRLANASRLMEGLGELLNALYEGDDSVQARLGTAQRALADLARLDEALGEAGGLLDTASIQVSEAADTLRRYLDSLDLDPARLEAVERRLELLHDLARKHHVTPQALPGHLAALRERLRALEDGASRVEVLEREQAAALERYQAAAKKLGAGRAKAAAEFSRRVTEQLRQLGMPHGTFQAAVTHAPAGTPQQHGDDLVEYQVMLNPGQPERPLAKVASGGELSRISLAVQVTGGRDRGIPTLIFDEVDAGIGGAVAGIVGALLKRLSGSRQVLCVTHLPQVAARGDHHLRVEKKTGRKETHTTVTPLGDRERVEEIARMLGGLTISDKTRAAARELLGESRRKR
jgi:DNA repair protein RecN (Recombination protein N)